MTARRLVSFALILSGAILCGMAGLHYLRGFEAQQEARVTFEKALAKRQEAPALPVLPEGRDLARTGFPLREPPAYPEGQPIAWLLIPSAQIDAIVLAGSSPQVLDKGPGHVPGTELPGRRSGLNNCVITAHRDSYFRNLNRVRKGERIELTTPDGLQSYRVVSREVVKADSVGVLAPTAKPRLTLITCYPFNFVGHAPNRLVVVAEPEATNP